MSSLSKYKKTGQFKDYFCFFLIAVLPVIISFIRKLPIAESIGFVTLVDEFTLILLANIALLGLVKLVKNKYGICLLLFFVFYLLIGFATAVANYVNNKQIIYQGVLELKLIIVLAIVIGLPNRRLFYKRFIVFGKVVLLVSIPLILWQFVLPNSYDAIFFSGAHTGEFSTLSGEKVGRAAGVFWFTGDLAIFASFFCINFLFDFLRGKKRISLYWLIVSGIVLAATLSRLEIMATLSVCMLVYVRSQKGVSLFIWIILLSIISLLIVVALYPYFILVFEQMGFSQYSTISSSEGARRVFSENAIILAGNYFPFGTGLGTYGGHAADVFNSQVYYDMGFTRYGWFARRLYMTDVFWPHVLGETGVLGLLFYLTSLYFLFLWINKQFKISVKEKVGYRLVSDKVVSQIGLSCFLVMLINSLASSNLTTFYSLFLGLFMVGLLVDGGYEQTSQ